MPSSNPSVSQSVTDGALAAASGDALNVFAVVGIASLATANVLYTLSDVQQVRTTLGYGPGAEQVAQILNACAGKATVLFVCPTLTAGSLTAGSQVGSGTADVADSSSTPNDDYDLVVKILSAGVDGKVGNATFVYSLDGGRTWSDEIATAATYAIPSTGITLAFTSGGADVFVAGDRYTFEAKGPTFTVNNLNTALTAVDLDGRSFELLHCVGIPADASTTNSVAAALKTFAEAMALKHRYHRVVMDGPEGVTNSALKTALTTTTGHVLVGADFCPLESVLRAGIIEKRPAAWPIMSKACKVPFSVALHATDPAESGPLERVSRLRSLQGEAVSYSYHDDFTASTKLTDGGRIASLRTWPGEEGVYITRGRTLALLTSDYSELHFGRIIDQALRIAYRFMFKTVGKRLLVNTTTGRILESEARGLEEGGSRRLIQGLVNEKHATRAELLVLRDDNVLSTRKLRYRVRVVPLFYPDFLDGESGFLNPAIFQV